MSDIKSLKGKKILITSYSYANFGGAELNAVELADQLVSFGMIPTFFSYDTEGPLKNYIEERFSTKVLTDRINRLSESEDQEEMGITRLNISDYDYIWIGGNTIPMSIIRQINSAQIIPKFIFIHMSQLIGFPLDAPLTPYLESKIASRILSISSKTTSENIQRILGNSIDISMWPNPVPPDFQEVKKRSGKLRRVAIISSSHPSQEILDVGPILEGYDITVEYVGRFAGNVKEVDAKFYNEYDLIIGIGKNARYSMVSGVPIYIYGRFGGGGYLSDDNLEVNEENNLSGRGFGTKNAEKIASEIISGYKEALNFHEKYRSKFTQEYSIDYLAKDLFSELEMQKNVAVKFDQEYINWLVSMQINLMQRAQLSASARKAWSQLDANNKRIEELENLVEKSENEIIQIKKELRDVYTSNSWKVTKPLRLIMRMFKLALNKD